MSKIEWTEKTWNPVTGCTKCSQACDHCYAERMARRLQAAKQAKYRNGFRVTLHPDCLEEPLRWKKPCRVFVCSMSDLFHPDVPDVFRDQVFDTMERARWHTFQVLTKRWASMALYIQVRYCSMLKWGREQTRNIWLGMSAWDQRSYEAALHATISRIGGMSDVLFLSLEPLLGPVRILEPLARHLDWIIIGGESGPGARPMDDAWVRGIIGDCNRLGIPVFYKQRLDNGRKISMPEIDGRTWAEYPALVNVGKEKETLFAEGKRT
jgi:protein gp37